MMKVICVLLCAQVMVAQGTHKTWSEYGGGPDNSHYLDLSQITKENVSKLAPGTGAAEDPGERLHYAKKTPEAFRTLELSLEQVGLNIRSYL
jgi:hypothetical protein